MSQPTFIEFRHYGGPKRLEWLLVQAAAFNAGAGGDARNTDVTPATIAKPTSSRSPSFTAPSRASSGAASVRLPTPVSASSRHDSTAEAPATPMLVPNTRIRLRRP